MNYYISASVLSADMFNLSSECKRMEQSGVDMLHFDVMDGSFVDNISFGIPVLQSLNKGTDLFMDVHLMIRDPLKYIDEFVKAGSDCITFHFESDSDPLETIRKIKSYGIKAGISIKPGTPVSAIYDLIPLVDMVLVMTVEPGFGGQGFIIETLDKIKEVRKYIDDHSLKTDVEVDGGINDQTIEKVKEAGANVFVSGSYLFKAASMKSAVESLK